MFICYVFSSTQNPKIIHSTTGNNDCVVTLINIDDFVVTPERSKERYF